MNKKVELKKSVNSSALLVVLALVAGFAATFGVPVADAQKRGAAKTKNKISRSEKKRERKAGRENDRREEEATVITRNGKKYYLTAEKDLARFGQPAEREEWFVNKRLPKNEKSLPTERYFAAIERIKKMKRFSTAQGKLLPSQQDAPKLELEMAEASRAAAANGGSTGGVLGTWVNLGPGNVGGRTRGLLINPTNPSIMYAGAVAGGIWKSTDAGSSWFPLDDFLPNIAVTSLAFDPTNANVIYAGTGEGFFNADAVRGAGIFKTTDAGVTWNRLAATANNANFYYVQDVLVSPVNAQRLYAATRTGVQRSLDGGATWTTVLASNAANGLNGAMDLVMRNDQTTDYIYAAIGTFAQSHIWRNTDAGGSGTWTDVYTEANMGRTSLALAPSNQNVIYALSASIETTGNYTGGGLLAVFRSTTSGDGGSWTAQVRNTAAATDKQSTLLLSNPINGVLTECGFGTSQYINQGWYHNQIVVDPTDSNIVWSAGTDIWRSDNGGVNWGVASYWWFQGNGIAPANGDPQLVHADNHVIAFHPNYDGTTNQTIYIGDDGGVYRTQNGKTGNVGYAMGTTPAPGAVTATSPICGNEYTPGGGTTVPTPVSWSPLNNGYQVTQFYHGLPYPNGTRYFGGTQDNGTNRGSTASGVNGWERIFGGDGGYVAINPANTNVLYAETTGLSIKRSDNGGTSFVNKVSGISDTFPFITVFQMDPNTPTRLWIGGRFMWRTDNSGDTWTRTSAAQQTGGSITAIAIAPTNSNVVMNGAASGQIRRTTTATTLTSTSDLNTNWLQSFTPRGNGFGAVSWLAYDPNNISNVYATFSAFNTTTSGNGFGHVFKSADGGATWTLIDGTGVNSIPDIPVHSIVVDPNNSQRLYVGTDLGVFVTLDGGANWLKETTGFSNTVTESLSVINNNGVSSIFAFTHGRSAFKVTIPASCTSVSPTTQTMSAAGGAGSVTITKNPTATATCDWNAVSNSDFITVNAAKNDNELDPAGISGTDSGTVNFTVAPNTTGATRTGTLTVAGTVVTITQAPSGPTAAPVTVGGRVTNAKGRGIGSAQITMTDSQGSVRTAVTTSFGYYRFTDVSVGQTYVFNVRAKGYTFDQSAQVTGITGETDSINFVGR